MVIQSQTGKQEEYLMQSVYIFVTWCLANYYWACTYTICVIASTVAGPSLWAKFKLVRHT